MLQHPIKPVFDEYSKILILGSFPSVKSREEGFFYGHPQNRFWRVVSAVCKTDSPVTIEEKKRFLLDNHIAVWEVIKSCDITGSSDSSIKNVVPNDLHIILDHAPIEKILVNGKKAEQLNKRYIQPDIGREAVCLPSTSPANAVWSLEKLIETWKKEMETLQLYQDTGIKQLVIDEICQLAKTYKIEKVILFGSRARGDYKSRSDIDLACTGGDCVRFMLAVDEETSTLLKYDIVNLDNSVQEELLQSIQKEGRVIYEKI